ncbi:MAG TPA: glutamate formimidoyltransferase [Bacteroidales bacterium]|jgi:glutamate formiminotransferase/formiminotetrahydrofolate cyclodeaminase|nr:glutamate formimidoyltransferase [Bacteroidales bacterium]HQH23910.1 glutamate formimidoyltransferase [Bacteroidales bacterium]HQJ81240.1 glutamate formimidoyltransferase [Bacteroidales bacterium]
MTKRILECVPNFSEGRDMAIIKQITDEIESVENVKLLDVDPGRDTNRTVVTFAGEPDAVAEAAFRAVKKASEVIDMSRHRGEHPRMGATDVCPFVPVSGISMEETVIIARKVAERIGKELNIPVFCYENAAFRENRRSLAHCRSGEYEGLEKKFSDPEWKPDFGPAVFNRKSGATAVGARDFLVAFNVNLNTTSTRRANAIAFDVRESGRDIINEKGEKVNVPGSLRSVRAIGWYIKEYGIAQISMNLTDISVTPVHLAFDEVCRKAEARGVRVTGSELVGLIPLRSLLEAGKYFLEKQKRSAGLPDEELIHIAVRSMGLDELQPFRPEEKIIEYLLEKEKENLTSLSLKEYMDMTASELPVPGGGSASAYMGALGVALGTMVANLSAHRKDWDERWKEFSVQAARGTEIQNMLLNLVDADTDAYNKIIEARRLPKSGDKERELRNAAIQEAYKQAILVPLKVMETAYSGFEIVKSMTETGNPSSVTDAAVGSLALLACIRGAHLNIKINATGVEDSRFTGEILSRAGKIEEEAVHLQENILTAANRRISL